MPQEIKIGQMVAMIKSICDNLAFALESPNESFCPFLLPLSNTAATHSFEIIKDRKLENIWFEREELNQQ